MLLYANDFDETPPFVGIGHTDLGKDDKYANIDPDPTHGEFYFMDNETWLLPYGQMRQVALDLDWTSLPGGGPTAEEGSLYPYTRFRQMYLCPEFERVPVGTPGRAGRKSHNVFNYSRSVLGRKFLSNVPISGTPFPDPGAEDWAWPGPIMKMSAIYAPAAMMMMIDEQWDFHVAGNYNDHGTGNMVSGYWQGAETIHGLVGDMFGSYHSTKTRVLQTDAVLMSLKASVAHYDGHVDLYIDPLPWRYTTLGNIVPLVMEVGLEAAVKLFDPLFQSLYAQRGIGLPLEKLLELLGLG